MCFVILCYSPNLTLYHSHYSEGYSLRALQADGQVTNQNLAQLCNISPAACFDRVKRRRTHGVISGYTALLDSDKVDHALMIFVEVLLDRTTDDIFASFAAHARSIPEVLDAVWSREASTTYLRSASAIWPPTALFLGETLVAMPDIRETRTYAVLEEVKATPRLAGQRLLAP
jgi:Lrp/AsnC family transcriptional regulator, leucine-responsive regulatory protein